jgi:cytochrome P450
MDTRLMSLKRTYQAAANVFGRYVLKRAPLPPGDLNSLDELERADRRLLLKLAATHGPIFKGISEDRLVVCVIGLAMGRRLLKEHGSALQQVSQDVEVVIPKGCMRKMDDDLHREYRKALVRGVNRVDLNECSSDLKMIIADGLSKYELAVKQNGPSPHAYLATLTEISGGMLFRLFFGANPGTEIFDKLTQIFNQLGPHGVVWNLAEKQIEAYSLLYKELRRYASSEAEAPSQAFASSIYGHLIAQEAVDETLLGNLINMVEMGRYDLRGLLRWISRYASENPEWVERIAEEEENASGTSRPVSEAFVLETLRMDQSERLMRTVKQDIVFDGFNIPKDALIRIGLWEAHKDDSAFPDPFVFDPSRFLAEDRSPDKFSPFGLDQHQCPFSTISVALGAVFLRTLVHDYQTSPLGNGPAVRGAYHWEPPPGFTVALQRRPASG